MPAWNDWFHLMANTFGTWPPGDERGFRTRDHREHIEGDYKNPPPPGRYDGLLDHTQKHMTRPPVHLSPAARRAAALAVRLAMVDIHHLQVLALAISAEHLHVLVRLPATLRQKPTLSKRGTRTSSLDDPARHYLGIAKKESAKSLAAARLAAPGGIWARRGKVKPIADRAHQLRVYQYILNHAQQGAAVWSFRDA
ncbi:MAG: hypothetical protein GC162_07730 [Planctomycetes bacterium]|nr:hypothetical protein [Planctomycetota bacterium]